MKRLVAALVAVLAGLLVSRADSGEPGPWDSYQVLMWSTGDLPAEKLPKWFERLKELGATGEQCMNGNDAAPFVENKFGFYVENMVSELAFLHSRKKLYDDDWEGYWKTRDKKFLVRKPCFDDPAFLPEAKKAVQESARAYAEKKPLLYDLRDELSIGSYASPMDYCFCEHTLAAFRAWLKTQYGTLDALNAEWGTKHASWDAVVPMTTWEVKDRERAALAAKEPENWAPWADHRAFMDRSFAETLARLRAAIREVDPNALVGVEGTQMPSAWCGYDQWRLSQAVDWVEPYDIAGAHAILSSFMPEKAPILETIGGPDHERTARSLLLHLLRGNRGCIVWDDDQSRSIDKTGDLPLTDRGKKSVPIFAELKKLAPRLRALQRVRDPIAIHYSQASIRAHWMIESREDNDTWARRFSSYEAVHSRFARARMGWLRALEDLGFGPVFLSYEQIEKGELRGTKVLVLPESIAMSKKECAEVEAFVRGGGTLVATPGVASLDEHCRRLERSGLGALAEPGEHALGKGRAFAVDLDMAEYHKDRLVPPAGKAARELVKKCLHAAGLEPPVPVLAAGTSEPLPSAIVFRFKGKGVEWIAVARNFEPQAGDLKEVGYPDQDPSLEKPAKVTLHLPRKAAIANARTGASLGTTDRPTFELDPFSPTILELK